MTTEETVLTVGGMSCGACVRHVTSALRTVPGVAGATVDLGAGRAVVAYDPAVASAERIATAVTDAGYPAAILSGGRPDE